MRDELKEIFIRGCNEKIEKKGENVGLSFYAFFKNKNDNPELLMEAAHWWIMSLVDYETQIRSLRESS